MEDEMRSLFDMGNMRSRFDLIRVENAIGGWVWGYAISL